MLDEQNKPQLEHIQEIAIIREVSNKTLSQINDELRSQCDNRQLVRFLQNGLITLLENSTELNRFEIIWMVDWFINRYTHNTLIKLFRNEFHGSILTFFKVKLFQSFNFNQWKLEHTIQQIENI